MVCDSQWSHCFQSFIRSLQAKSEQTAYTYAVLIRRFFRCCNKHPASVTRQDVEAFIYSRNVLQKRNGGQDPSKGSQALRLSILKSFYTFASTYLVPGPDGKEIPLFSGSLPTLGIGRGRSALRYHALSLEEVRAFFSAIDTTTVLGKRDFALFLTYFYTARRLTEISSLVWGDLERSMVMDGVTGREAWVYYFYGKGRKHIRDVAELPEPCVWAITDYLQASGRLETIEKDDPLWLAVGPPGGGGNPKDPFKPLCNSAIQNAMKRYCKLAGLDVKRFSVHSWRHTAARQRVILGADVLEINKLLRHKSLNTTFIYVNMLVGQADNRAKQLETQFSFLSKI